MDWTWAFDDYVGAALALGTMAGVLGALLWWAAGASGSVAGGGLGW